MNKTILFALILSISSCIRGSEAPLEPYSEQVLKKAEDGDPHAQFIVGRSYYYGKGVQKDLREAAKWFFLSAKQNYARSQNALGMLFRDDDIESPETDREINKATPELSF
jgi:TPR repeat protein